MTMTVREAFEKGTEAFNAHDMRGFAEVVADDVVFQGQAAYAAKERRHASSFSVAGSLPFPTRKWTCTTCTSSITSPLKNGTFTGTHNGILRVRWRHATNRLLGQNQLHPRAALPGWQANLVQLDV